MATLPDAVVKIRAELDEESLNRVVTRIRERLQSVIEEATNPPPVAQLDEPHESIETRNDFLFSIGGGAGDTAEFSFIMPPTGFMNRETVIRTAAWMLALADPMQRRFPAVYRAICNT